MLSDSAELLPSGARERVVASALRVALTVLLKPVLSPLVPIAAQRWWMHQLARLNRPARGVAVEPATVGGVAGEWLRATSSGNRTILYLHGGGFCTGSPATHRALTSRLARASGLPVFAADYRLAPEHPFPAATEDAISAYLALSEGGPVILAGDSAGARLALVTALAARERDLRPPAALVLFSPWIDLLNIPPAPADLTTRPAWLRACAERSIATPRATLASPLRADLRSLPPTLIQAGADELLRRDAVDLHDVLERADVAVRCELVPRRWHAFQLHAGMLPSADAALARAAQFIPA